MAIDYGNGKVEFVGLVIELRERYAGFERDVFEALVPDGKGGFRWEEYASDNSYCGGQYAGGRATVDAPESLKVEAKAWLAEQERLAYEREMRERAEREARTPTKGKVVRVVKGRKVAVGTEGTVVWYGDGYYGKRVGIKDAAGTVHWTAADNVTVIAAA